MMRLFTTHDMKKRQRNFNYYYYIHWLFAVIEMRVYKEKENLESS